MIHNFSNTTIFHVALYHCYCQNYHKRALITTMIFGGRHCRWLPTKYIELVINNLGHVLYLTTFVGKEASEDEYLTESDKHDEKRFAERPVLHTFVDIFCRVPPLCLS